MFIGKILEDSGTSLAWKGTVHTTVTMMDSSLHWQKNYQRKVNWKEEEGHKEIWKEIWIEIEIKRIEIGKK